MTARTLLLGGVSALLLCGAAVLAGCGDGSAAPTESADVTPAAPAEDPNALHPDGSTPLMWAVYDGDAERAARLIEAGADVNASNRYGSNAMQLAAEVADVGMLTMLLDAGADADSPNPEGQTALMLVARTGNVEAARLLVEHGATVDAREGWGEQTALMWASARRQPEMVEYLIEQGADMNARSTWRDYQRHITSEARAKSLDTGGLTPLLYAARENCVDCARVLIEHGVDVDLPDPDRVSPLLLSVLNGNWDVAKLLIEAGADVDQWDIFGQSPLYAIASRAQDMDRTSIDPLTEATGIEVMRLMLDAGAEPNLQLFMRPADQNGGGISRGSTPLHAAANANDLEAVELLLAHGADASLNDADNESALMLAVQGRGGGFFGGPPAPRDEDNLAAVMVALHDAGTDVNANAMYHHLARLRGGTALHYAVRAGSGRAIDELVAMGADVDMLDPDGLTALDYAMAHGYIPFLQMRLPPRQDLVEKLEGHGATVHLPEEPYWPLVGPPVYYEATVWPLDATVPSRSYEDIEPSAWLADAVAGLQYTGTPQPEPVVQERDEASLESATTQASLDGEQILR